MTYNNFIDVSFHVLCFMFTSQPVAFILQLARSQNSQEIRFFQIDVIIDFNWRFDVFNGEAEMNEWNLKKVTASEAYNRHQ